MSVSTPEGVATTNYQLTWTNLNFQSKSSTFSKKFNPKISAALSELLILSFISSKPRQHSIVFHNVLVIIK